MEIFMFNIFIIIILGMICFMGGTIFATRNNNNNIKADNQRTFYRHSGNNTYINGTDNMSSSVMGNIHRENNNRQDMEFDRCYENGEITNLCTIIALKSIRREMKTMLSDIEKDALDKAVDNTITVEKLKAFIDNVELEDIDIDE